MKPAITFVNNWNNKLNCDLFTTIRSSNPEKLKYYESKVNAEFTVILNNKHIGSARLLAVRDPILKDVDPLLLSLDTGIASKIQLSDLFKKLHIEENTKVLILIFQRIK